MTGQNFPAGRCSPMPVRCRAHSPLRLDVSPEKKYCRRVGSNGRGCTRPRAGGDICHGVFRPHGKFCEGAERYFAGFGTRARSAEMPRRNFMRGIRRARRRIAIGSIARQSVRHFWRAMSGTIRIRSMRRRCCAGCTGGRGTRFHFVRRSRSGARPGRRDRYRMFAPFFPRRSGGTGAELIYTVRGSGFLHHMVRNLVGTFILVGKGTLQADDVTRIIEARNRSAAGATAPASGLYLVGVEY